MTVFSNDMICDMDMGYKGTRVVVVGAPGFIGRWVARVLCEQKAQLFLFIRDKLSSENVFSRYGIHGNVIEQDLCDLVGVQKQLRRIRPSITFNLAGYGIDRSEKDEGISYLINAHLVRVLSETIAQIKDKNWVGQDFVHVGSALEYGNISGNLSENSTPNPTTIYGKSKLAGTNYLIEAAREQELRGLTARLFTVYGPGEHPERLLPSLIKIANTGESLSLTEGKQLRDFEYVEDVAKGLIALGLSQVYPGEIVNLATGILTPVARFVETAASILGIKYQQLLFGKTPVREEEMRHLPVSIERLRELIEWEPAKIAEGIKKTADFYSTV